MSPDPRPGNPEADGVDSVDEHQLAHRVRALLADRPTLREVAMFGGQAFMVDDRMVVSVQRNGRALLVRVDPEEDGKLLTRPGARRARMGRDRPMGEGWISVASDAIDTDAGLGFWMDVAVEYHASQAPDAP